MSFTEMLECVKMLSPKEQRQLHDALLAKMEAPKEDLDNWFKPGMTAYMTPEMHVDEWVMERMLNPSPDAEGV